MRDERELRELKRIASNVAFISWTVIISMIGAVGWFCINFL